MIIKVLEIDLFFSEKSFVSLCGGSENGDENGMDLWGICLFGYWTLVGVRFCFDFRWVMLVGFVG
jgi:hypothetical protein